TLVEEAPRPSPALEEETRRLCRQALADRRRARWRKLCLWTTAAAALLILSAGTILSHLPLRQSPASPASPAVLATRAKAGEPWEDLMLDTEFSLANDDLSSLELQLDLLVVDLF
ncbi:MAG: hypothetical protein ACI4SG_00430, partial [Oligosphaeraceae bacterium]